MPLSVPILKIMVFAQNGYVIEIIKNAKECKVLCRKKVTMQNIKCYTCESRIYYLLVVNTVVEYGHTWRFQSHIWVRISAPAFINNVTLDKPWSSGNQSLYVCKRGVKIPTNLSKL